MPDSLKGNERLVCSCDPWRFASPYVIAAIYGKSVVTDRLHFGPAPSSQRTQCAIKRIGSRIRPKNRGSRHVSGLSFPDIHSRIDQSAGEHALVAESSDQLRR